MIPDVISTEELFLLCTMRGEVEAKNLQPYLWTILHSSHAINRFYEMVNGTEDKGENHDHFMQIGQTEAKDKYPVFISEMRKFSIIGLHEPNFTATMNALELIVRTEKTLDLDPEEFFLFEQESQLAWYSPKCDMHNSDWNYCDQFELRQPLTNQEAFFLRWYSID
jgi:hypothetical protein